MRWLFFSLLFLVQCGYFRTLTSPLPENFGVVQGIVQEEGTHLPLAQVVVSCQAQRTETNQYGAFSLKIPLGPQQLKMKKAGYEENIVEVEVIRGKNITTGITLLKPRQKIVRGEITEATTWQKEEALIYTVVGLLRVPAGLRLTIKPGIRVQFQSDEQGDLGEIRVKGELIAQGDFTKGEEITFTSAQKEKVEGDWGGLAFEEGGKGKLTGCLIEYAENGIHGYYAGLLEVVSCVIRYNNSWSPYPPPAGVFVSHTPLILKKNTIQFNGDGVYISHSQEVEVKGNVIEYNRRNGLRIRHSWVWIEKNTIRLNGQNGIWYEIHEEENKGVIQNNNIYHNGKNTLRENQPRQKDDDNQYAVKGNGTFNPYIEVSRCYIAYNDGCNWNVGERYPRQTLSLRRHSQCEDFIRVYFPLEQMVEIESETPPQFTYPFP
jgi:hypothetical protein